MPTQPVATTMVQIDRIHPNPNQPRKYFDPQAIEDLKDSMAQRGLINPISVVKSGEWDYTIIAGERRYRAARELKWDQIDCRIWPAETTSQEAEMLSLVENLQRQDLNPIEVANGYKLLTQPPYSMTQEEIAKQVGKTQQAVQQYLSIAALDNRVQENTNRFVNLGLAHLLQICRLKTPEDQLEMAKKASKGEWTVKKLAGEVDKKVASPGSPGRPPSPMGRGTGTPQGEAGEPPYQFKLSGSDVLFSGRMPLAGEIDSEMANLKAALLQWLHAPQGVGTPKMNSQLTETKV